MVHSTQSPQRHAADQLVRAARHLVGNPFGAHAAEWREAKSALTTTTRGHIGVAVARACTPEELELVVIALGHVQACAASDIEPSALLGPRHLGKTIWRRLPRSRAAYVRLCAAAGRLFHALKKIRGSSERMRDTRRLVWAACFGESLLLALSLERVIHDHDVLILGETGTGKEAVARAIQAGATGDALGAPPPHAAVNAAAIPATLVESELFGHVRGAFTGASEPRMGRIRSANGGTFFLDEVGDLELHTQVKLLRVIETNEVTPVGSDIGERVEVRYVAATHGDLERDVEEGRFRRDLYERLAGVVIRVAPLRERPEDIIDIGRAFVATYFPQTEDDRIERWLDQASRGSYAWPGNVRELQNALRSLMLGLDPGLAFTRSSRQRNLDAEPRESSRWPARIRDGVAELYEVEEWYMRRVLTDEDDNYAAAARRLGIDRSTLKRRIIRSQPQ